jgi:hypothetical protein
MRQAGGAGAAHMVEDHEGAERAGLEIGLVEGIDHGQAVGEPVGEAAGDQAIRVAARRVGREAIFDQPRVDMAVLDHHLIIDHVHVRHAAIGVARADIAAKERILLGRGARGSPFPDNIGVAARDPALGAGRSERLDLYAHGDAGPAVLAGRPISDCLRTAETGLRQRVVERRRPQADEMGEHLSLRAPWQIGARRGGGEVELRRVARLFGHECPDR